MSIVIGLTAFLILAQIVAAAALVWLSWKFFDQRYKKNTAKQTDLLSGSLEPTSEIFIDPKDHLKYRVYYNRATGEREYVREDA